jgi:glycerophosphoryl diester phosphodiesterase
MIDNFFVIAGIFLKYKLTKKVVNNMTKNIAHRGFSKMYPENTMLAFRKAVEAGCDGIELDVQLTKDNQLVIIHDENTRRTTNRSGLVKDYILSELRCLDASNGFEGKFGFNPIPTMNEYFEFIKDKNVFTNIELKNSVMPYDGMEEKIIDMIREFGLTDKVLFSSFNHFSMVKCKKLSPASQCAFLTSCWQIGAGAYAKQNGVDFINPYYNFLTDENIKELNDHQIGAQAWTVDLEEDMKRLVDRDIFAIITNCPDDLKKILDSKKRNG